MFENECDLRLSNKFDSRIVISCGVNDTVFEDGRPRVNITESRKNIQKILQAVLLKYKVIIVGPPPVNDDVQNKRIKEINDIFKDEANLSGIAYIETFSHLVVDVDYRSEIRLNDGAHPWKRRLL